jgi:hypothetical protein
MDKVVKYEIVTEKNVYFPGDIVRGHVTLTTSAPIECKGVRLMFEGRGHSYFVTGSGDDGEVRDMTKYYLQYKRTIWGKLYQTPVIDNAGENVCYGAPWSPGMYVI